MIGWTYGQKGIIVATIGPSFYTGATQSVSVPLCDDMPFEICWTAEGDMGERTGIDFSLYIGCP